MSFFDECKNNLMELKGTPASNITHTVSGWSDESSENGSGMVDGLLTVLAQLKEERDEDVRIAGVGGFAACAILCGVAYWLQVRKNRKKREEEEHSAIKKVKQEIQAVERAAETDKESIAEGKQSEQQS